MKLRIRIYVVMFLSMIFAIGMLFGYVTGVKTNQTTEVQELKDFFDSEITPRLSNGNLTANVSFITDSQSSVTIVILHAYERNETFRLWSNITFNEQTNEKLTFQKDYYIRENNIWVKYDTGDN